MSGRAVEAAGDCSTLLLDKTGTITYGNRMASEFLPVGGVDERELAETVLLSSLADETPEGRSIVQLAEDRYDLKPRDLDWTILRPGPLVNDAPTGLVTLAAPRLPRSSVTRADVAAVLAELLNARGTIGKTLELTNGETPVAEAVKAVL